MKARISQLHKTEAEWAAYASWAPDAGELIVYDPDEKYSYARIKIGDGSTPLSQLGFFIDSAVEAVLRTHNFTETVDAGRVTDHL